MISLGVYRGAGEHAAVVVNDGAVASAVHAPGATERGSLPDSAQRALAIAGVRFTDLDVVCSTDGETSGATQTVAPAAAHAAQVRAVACECRVAVHLDDHAGGIASIIETDTAAASEIGGMGAVLRSAASLATALGLSSGRPLEALESIASKDTDTSPAVAIDRRGASFCVRVDTSAIAPLVAQLTHRCPSPADVAGNPHIEVQRLRTQAATAMLESVAAAVAAVADRAGNGSRCAAFTGSAWSSPEFVARLRRRVDTTVVPVPEPFGQALGAALAPHRDVRPLAHLALGPAFDENEIKTALERCRLDYVYEPDWSRLYGRVSDLLATGALVGWYQGRADFSRQSFGSRSFLCDPSCRYSRENVNVFLLNRNVQAPLPLSLDAAEETVVPDGSRSRFAYATARPQADATPRIASAIDRHGRLLCHVADGDAAPEFLALLRTHRQRTNVPGLLNVPMLVDGVLAPTPREAIREMYGSAADALVIGRFLVAKDYWLLRGRAAATGAR